MDEGVALRTLSGAACLCPLVNTLWDSCNAVIECRPAASSSAIWIMMSSLSSGAAYREPYLFVTYFNSLDVIEVQGHASLGWVRLPTGPHCKHYVSALFHTSVSLLPVCQCLPTWTSQVPATWAQPSPPGPFTWPPPTRTSCGSSAVREVWFESLESCRGPAPAEGQRLPTFLLKFEQLSWEITLTC